MGDYDSAGRLIHPNTKTGPRKEVISYWDEKFRGWWRNDDAVHSLKGRKYADDIEKVWMPLWKKNHPETKTQVSPSVIIIQPSGTASVVEADVFCMSYREMSQLIDAEGLDSVHFSEPLNRITKVCRFRGYQIAMYADRNGYEKDMPDNAVGTMLYGRHAEIRGAVIIALEDNKFDTHSFHFKEDLDNVLVAISDLTGGLLTLFESQSEAI